MPGRFPTPEFIAEQAAKNKARDEQVQAFGDLLKELCKPAPLTREKIVDILQRAGVDVPHDPPEKEEWR